MSALRSPLMVPVADIDNLGQMRRRVAVRNGDALMIQVDFTGHSENYCEISLKTVFKKKEEVHAPKKKLHRPPPGTIDVTGP